MKKTLLIEKRREIPPCFLEGCGGKSAFAVEAPMETCAALGRGGAHEKPRSSQQTALVLGRAFHIAHNMLGESTKYFRGVGISRRVKCVCSSRAQGNLPGCRHAKCIRPSQRGKNKNRHHSRLHKKQSSHIFHCLYE